jgi:hypothetical protein
MSFRIKLWQHNVKLYFYKKHFATQYHFPLGNPCQEWEIFRNLQIGIFLLFSLTYAYDTGNNLTNLSHQANSNTWQQALTIHPNNNHGTETQQSTSDFDVNPVNRKFSIPLIYLFSKI